MKVCQFLLLEIFVKRDVFDHVLMFEVFELVIVEVDE